MTAYNKNFVVKHGLEVNNNLIVANADVKRVGVGTTNPLSTLDVRGGIGVSDINASGITTTSNLVINGGYFNAAGSPGIVGQYLRSTGTGVEWASFPVLRTDDSFTAGIGQTLFSYAYTPGFLDVYVNGVKLTETEFTATNGTQVFLSAPTFGGEVVDFVGYNPTAVSSGSTGILGITVKDAGTIVGNDNGVTSIDFVGTGINAVGTGAGVTVTFSADPGWAKTSTNVYTTYNVGVGTTVPQYPLHVVGVGTTSLFVDGNARITGILSIGTSSITLDGTSDSLRIGSGVTITSDTLTVSNLVVTNSSTIVGTGITVKDGASTYSASIIDFGSNLSVDFSSGIATVNATGSAGGGETLDQTLGLGNTSSLGMSVGIITATSFVKSGGTSNQFLKADGSFDSSTYATQSYVGLATVGLASETYVDNKVGLSTTGLLSSTGSAASLTSLTGASSGTYGSSSEVPVISVDSTGRITGITTSAVSGTGGLSSMPSRVSVAGTTSSISVGSTENITISGYKTYSLHKVGVSTAAWVVLYSDTNSRTTDASRSQTTDPSPGSGVISEIITGIGTEVLITPSIVGWNNDSTPSGNIYAKVTNLGSTTEAVTVVLTILKMED